MFCKLCFGLAALIVSFLVGCSTVESRIKSNPRIYASFSPADQALVRQGQISEGMPKAAVFLAWGNPDLTRSGVRLGPPFEVWRAGGNRARFLRTRTQEQPSGSIVLLVQDSGVGHVPNV